MAGLGGLQLLPQTRKRFETKSMGGSTFMKLSIVALVLVAASYAGLRVYRNSLFAQADVLNAQIDTIEKSRDKAAETKLFNFSQQMSSVNALLASHIFTSDALTRVQALVLPTVQFESFQFDVTKKTLTFKALADSYTTVARQVAAFYSESAITDISLNKVTTTQTGKIEFDMKLDFTNNKFITRGIQPSPKPQASPSASP